MRRLLSVAPVLLWLVTPLAFAQLPGITSQPLPGGGQSWSLRSEERRVGKECRSRWSPYH